MTSPTDGPDTAASYVRSEPRTAAQWWDAAGRTLAPRGTAARVALIMCSHTLAAELAGHLVRAGARGIRIGQLRALAEGGEVFGVEMHLAGTWQRATATAEHAQVLVIPQRARLPVYRWDDRDLATAEPITTVTVPGAADGRWLDLRAIATQLLALLGVKPPT